MKKILSNSVLSIQYNTHMQDMRREDVFIQMPEHMAPSVY